MGNGQHNGERGNRNGAPPLIRAAAAFAFLGAAAAAAAAATAQTTRPTDGSSSTGSSGTVGTGSNDLTSLSIEDLMNVSVTSVSKTRQRAAEAPAAVSVITQDDMKRWGLRSIPEALRLAPGLDVARLNANTWAISSRGFNQAFSNKLLVLMDGRTVYNPGFAGAYWDTVDYTMADLDRIEVIRGPGATLWGSNAVNGVINVTTKSARDTQGLLSDSYLSNTEQSQGVRYGGQLADDTWYRVYGKFKNTENFVNAQGDDLADGWESSRTGFRVDKYATPDDTFTLQGDAYRNLSGEPAIAPAFSGARVLDFDVADDAGGDVLARWTHTISPDSDFSAQLYYDGFGRDNVAYSYLQHTVDASFQHRFQLGTRQEIVWGGGYRFLADALEGKRGTISVHPAQRDDYMANLFLQDKLTVVPDHLFWYVGSKFELNSYSGIEIEPGTRLLWTPDDRNTLWGSIARAGRIPTRAEQNADVVLSRGTAPPGLPLESRLMHNPEFETEYLTAYEAGYRVRPAKSLSLDFAAFFNDYDRLQSIEAGAPAVDTSTGAPVVEVPLSYRNRKYGETYGLESAATWNATDALHVTGSHSLLFVNVHTRTGSTDTTAPGIEGAGPRNQFQLHVAYDVTKQIELAASAYYVENLPAGPVPSYLRVDLGVTWRPRDDMELSLGVQNLLDDRHPEFYDQFIVPASEVRRSVYGQFTVRF